MSWVSGRWVKSSDSGGSCKKTASGSQALAVYAAADPGSYIETDEDGDAIMTDAISGEPIYYDLHGQAQQSLGRPP